MRGRACNTGSTDTLDILLAAGASLLVSDTNGFTPFHYVAYCHSLPVCTYLSSKLPQKPPSTFINALAGQETALTLAVSRTGQPVDPTTMLGIVKILIQLGADPNVHLDDSHYAALQAAIKELAPTAVIKYLLDNHADPDQKTKTGGTAIMQIVFYRRPDVLKLLVASSRNVNAKNDCNLSAVDLTYFVGPAGTLMRFSTTPTYQPENSILTAAGAITRKVPNTVYTIYGDALPGNIPWTLGPRNIEKQGLPKLHSGPKQ